MKGEEGEALISQFLTSFMSETNLKVTAWVPERWGGGGLHKYLQSPQASGDSLSSNKETKSTKLSV